MPVSLRHLLGWIVSAFSSREELILENFALRQQLLALHPTRSRRRLSALHKLFWVALRKFWSGWTVAPLSENNQPVRCFFVIAVFEHLFFCARKPACKLRLLPLLDNNLMPKVVQIVGTNVGTDTCFRLLFPCFWVPYMPANSLILRVLVECEDGTLPLS